ncbi:MAG: hypothetical protein ABFC80_08905 [Coriobacteriales bacterium]|nr:hypothetical protein [Actinomycetes bacterium]
MPDDGSNTATGLEDARDTTDPESSRPDRKARRRLWFLPVIVAVIVVGVALVGLQSGTRHRQSPEYSLEQMARAAQDGDWNGVQRYIDATAVANAFMDAMMSQASAEETNAAAGSMSGAMTFERATEKMRKTFSAQFESALRDSVEKASASDGDPPSGLAYVSGAENVSYDDQGQAIVTVRLANDGNETQDVRLRMKQTGDHWLIIAVEGTSDLLGLVD